LIAFQKAHYAPNRTTLIFAGDISSDKAVELAEEYFGDWKRGLAEPVVPSGKISDGDSTRIVIVDRAAAQQVQIRLGHLGFKRSDPDYVTSRVFNQVFGGSFVSRLNKRIRVEEGLTYGARGGFSAGKEPGLLTVRTFTRPEGVGDTVRALLEELEKIREIAPTDEELADAKSYIIGSFGLSMETAEDVAGKVWDLKSHGLPFDYYDGYLKQIEQISSEQIQAFARKYVHPDKIKIVIVGREADIRPHVESIAPITVIKPGEKVPRPKDKLGPS
jgi:zinc protease